MGKQAEEMVAVGVRSTLSWQRVVVGVEEAVVVLLGGVDLEEQVDVVSEVMDAVDDNG